MHIVTLQQTQPPQRFKVPGVNFDFSCNKSKASGQKKEAGRSLVFCRPQSKRSVKTSSFARWQWRDGLDSTALPDTSPSFLPEEDLRSKLR